MVSIKKHARISIFLASSILVVCLSGNAVTLAHGTGGTFSTTVGDALIDVDYDTPVLVPDVSVRFDLFLRSASNGRSIQFDSVWVSIRPRGASGSVFGGELAVPHIGIPGITATFSSAGSYDFSVRYLKEGTSIAEAVFPFTVEPGTEGGLPAGAAAVFVGFIPGILLGAGLAWFIKKR